MPKCFWLEIIERIEQQAQAGLLEMTGSKRFSKESRKIRARFPAYAGRILVELLGQTIPQQELPAARQRLSELLQNQELEQFFCCGPSGKAFQRTLIQFVG